MVAEGYFKRSPSGLSTIVFLVVIALLFIIYTSSFLRWRLSDLSAPTFQKWHQQSGAISMNATSKAKHSIDMISIMVRMSAKIPKHRNRIYCDLFRTTVLFWPSSYGKIVVILDQESSEDHLFGEQIKKHFKQNFSHQMIDVIYESLPKDSTVLTFPSSVRTTGYNRQLWSSFFMDLYTNDSIIAWMDTDSAFLTPVTKASIFNGTRVRILGCECSMAIRWIKLSASTNENVLGLPMVADFMTYFPVYLYRDTFTNCREYILKRFKTSNFEEAFNMFYHTGTGYISPVSVIISYAWFFEYSRYDWSIKVCSNLETYNKRFTNGFKIGTKEAKNLFSQPHTAYHTSYGAAILNSIFPISFCLTQERVGEKPTMCSKHTSAEIKSLLILFNADLQRIKEGQTECIGNMRNYCLEILERHFQGVALEVRRNERRLEWEDLEKVEKLTREIGITCSKMKTKR